MAINKINDYVEFNYTGGMQSFTPTISGIYKFEVYGGQGGNASGYTGGKGGYSVGYKYITRNTPLYIGVGGKGGNAGSGYAGSGGYNGGGYGYWSQHEVYWDTYCAGGGGATHIAKVNGTLASIGQSSFTTNGLIVAGGGGGGAVAGFDGVSNYGESGGGLTGGGYNFGQGRSGQSHSAAAWSSGGGGGGYQGGDCGHNTSAKGGTGNITNVPSITIGSTTFTSSTTNNVRSGNGYAKITLVSTPIYIKANSQWQSGIPYIKINGTWKNCTPYIKVNGAWKQ